MEYKTIGGVTLPVLCFGTGAMGPHYSVDKVRDDARIHAIQCAIENSITHIDTAERYGGGRSEELIAEAIKGYDRQKLFITSKVSKEHLRYDVVLSSARASSKRLQTYIDLYLIHQPDPAISIEETMSAMNKLVDEGLVRFIGLSNFSSAQDIEQAQKWSTHKLFAHEIEYSLFARNKAPDCQQMESETIPYCQEHDLLVLVYKPLARGQLAHTGHAPLDMIAAKYGKTPAQVALNWIIHQKDLIPITQALNPNHLKDNLGALRWRLEQTDVELLSREMKRD